MYCLVTRRSRSPSGPEAKHNKNYRRCLSHTKITVFSTLGLFPLVTSSSTIYKMVLGYYAFVIYMVYFNYREVLFGLKMDDYHESSKWYLV